jgi:hypothetical protein
LFFLFAFHPLAVRIFGRHRGRAVAPVRDAAYIRAIMSENRMPTDTHIIPEDLMTRLLRLLIALPLLLLPLSCTEDESSTDPNTLDGETNLALTEVGTHYGIGVELGGTYLDGVKDTVYISSRANGIITMRVHIDSLDHPLWPLIPRDLKDANGNVDTEVHFKVTSNGIQDFYYSKQDLARPFTLVKYDCKVGDTYEFTTADGKKVTRRIIEKSETDDFPWGLWLIKTIATEETPQIEGVKKILFRTNHRFGLVYAEYTLIDGTPLKVWLYTSANV